MWEVSRRGMYLVMEVAAGLMGDISTSAGNIEGWRQVGELGAALLLSSVIGFEREFRQKSAGLRTHTLVGLGAALFVLVSKYGFNDVLLTGKIVLDPSRVAAQIVSGIGFLGAGIIFVRRNSVHGLTTAASVWLTAAVGSAAGAGLPLLAGVTTTCYLVVVFVFKIATDHLPTSSETMSTLRARYPDGQGVLRQVLKVVSEQGFSIDEVATELRGAEGSAAPARMVDLTLQLHGRGSLQELVWVLSELPGVTAVFGTGANANANLAL